MVSGCIEKLQAGVLSGKPLIFILLLVSLTRAELIDRVIANVGGEPVLESEVRLAGNVFGVNDLKKAVQMLVEKHAIAVYLRSKGFKVPPDYIDRVIEDIARSNGKTVSELYRELYEEGFAPSDFRHLIEVEVASTLLYREFLSREIEISEIEIELERLKKGEVEYLKEIKLLTVPKSKKNEVLEAVAQRGGRVDALAKELGVEPEILKVKKGELLQELDAQVWGPGSGIAVAEDEENIYLAEVVRTIRVFKGRSEDEIREEIFMRKLKEKEKEMLSEIKKEIFIEVFL